MIVALVLNVIEEGDKARVESQIFSILQSFCASVKRSDFNFVFQRCENHQHVSASLFEITEFSHFPLNDEQRKSLAIEIRNALENLFLTHHCKVTCSVKRKGNYSGSWTAYAEKHSYTVPESFSSVS